MKRTALFLVQLFSSCMLKSTFSLHIYLLLIMSCEHLKQSWALPLKVELLAHTNYAHMILTTPSKIEWIFHIFPPLSGEVFLKFFSSLFSEEGQTKILKSKDSFFICGLYLKLKLFIKLKEADKKLGWLYRIWNSHKLFFSNIFWVVVYILYGCGVAVSACQSVDAGSPCSRPRVSLVGVLQVKMDVFSAVCWCGVNFHSVSTLETIDEQRLSDT